MLRRGRKNLDSSRKVAINSEGGGANFFRLYLFLGCLKMDISSSFGGFRYIFFRYTEGVSNFGCLANRGGTKKRCVIKIL